jgi:RimJ/RimL family protein N-acetyltransferase
MDAQARRTSMARVEAAWDSGRSAPLVVADAATGEPVGTVNLRFRDDRTAAVAYSVFPEHRGQGVAPRAVRLLARWAFGELGVRRLLLAADEANSASLRVAEKSGFRRLGTRTTPRPGGGHRTAVVFARTEP